MDVAATYFLAQTHLRRLLQEWFKFTPYASTAVLVLRVFEGTELCNDVWGISYVTSNSHSL